MNTLLIILSAIIIVIVVYFLIVAIPLLFGKLFLHWSGKRIRYIASQSFSDIISSVIGTLMLSGLALLLGVILKQRWAFAIGLFIMFTFRAVIKSVAQNIKASANM